MVQLYHYYHCPFCVRIRLSLGYLGIQYESKPLSYDDEKTPVELCGKKMLPILVKENGESINESLDIVQYLDSANKLQTKEFLSSNEKPDFEALLDQLGAEVHNLAMPHWIYTKEFNETSRKYFQSKKEQKRGPFSGLIQNKKTYLENLAPFLSNLEGFLKPYYKSEVLRLEDILLASHLWGLYIVPEFQFPSKLHSYLQSIGEACHFHYLDALWE